MTRESLSGDHKTIQALWDWYECQSKLSLGKKSQVLIEMRNDQTPTSDPLFFSMTADDVEEFFRELDDLIMFDLLAAAEAAIRVDFRNRVDNRKKDDVSRQFRRIDKKKGKKVALQEEILDVWKKFRPTAKRAVGDFNGALNLRHWLAHGRYWTPKLGRTYSPADVYDIAHNLLKAIAT